MYFKTVTHSSIVISSNEERHRKAIAATVRRLAESYEVVFFDMKSMTSAEFYLDLNMPRAERACLIHEVFQAYDTELSAIKA